MSVYFEYSIDGETLGNCAVNREVAQTVLQDLLETVASDFYSELEGYCKDKEMLDARFKARDELL